MLGGVPEGFHTSKCDFVCLCVCLLQKFVTGICYMNLLHEFVYMNLLQAFCYRDLLQEFVTGIFYMNYVAWICYMNMNECYTGVNLRL